MKIDYERKSVLLSWNEFSCLSRQAKQDLIGKGMTPEEIIGDKVRGKMGNRNGDEARTVMYSGSGICIKYLNADKMSIDEFYKVIPDEVKILEVNQDFYNALVNAYNKEDIDMENV